MSKMQSSRDLADGWLGRPIRSLHGKHQLMLLGLDSGSPRCFLTEMEELPDLISEIGKRPIVAGGELRRT